MPSCSVCHRPLKDPASIRRGMGPVCAARFTADADERSHGVSVTVDGRPLPHIVRHSPTGFEWGYGGSGPADLALSILADYLGEQEAVRRYIRPMGWVTENEPLTCRLYQQFKWAFVARFDRQSWRLTGAEIAAWLRAQGVEAPERDVVYEGRRAA